ncbi:MAG: hypothetical protein AMXMBFR53_09200 [Gemmatimonadota bacterium]
MRAPGGLFVLPLALTLLMTGACGQDAQRSQSSDVGGDSAPPTLVDIMRGLDADMAAVAHGLWTADVPAIAAAARKVADHPKVTPETAAAIQSALGAEFGDFAAYDHQVHDAATRLSEIAQDGEGQLDVLLAGYQGIQEGCVACHTQFRARVSAALGSGADGR